ncbi:MAG TPA: SDR family NAD(P)-dependent oxidoreductase [Acidimicrobiales bacterium]|nr:SDR family NAD(P)-dependent oxidoreductase [Acidimicrobiales bacterium]
MEPLNWNGRSVLVTGGEGFIGSNLVERLVREGADVRALVHYNPFGRAGWLDPEVHREVRVLPGDVRDAERVFTAVDGCDVVFHLAALIGIPYSYLAPESYVQVNVTGTSHVARACLRAGVSRMVHTSTSETYGTALSVPISEDHPLQPQSPYSASKIGGDMMALSFFHAFELPVAVVRPFNTYGPRQSTRAVIPTILSQLHAGAEQIQLGTTTPTRDFNYVDDTVAGFLAVAACDRAVGEVVNIGSGREISIGDLVQLLIAITGGTATVTTDPARLRPAGSEVERLLCDNTRARQWAGWLPEVPLEEGLRRTSDWIRDNRHLLGDGGYAV